MAGRSRTAGIAAAGALALALGLAPAVGAAETLGLDPQQTRAGTVITVTDEAFTDPAGGRLDLPTPCMISLDGKEVSDLCEVDATGALEGTFAVPEGMADGEYEVEAVAGELSATAKLTVSADAPEQKVEDPQRRVISTPVGPSDKNGKTPVYVLVMAAVATLGIVVFRAWRARNPANPAAFAGGYRPATGRAPKMPKPPGPARDEQKPPAPRLNIPPPPGKGGAAANAPGPAPAPAAAPAGGAQAGGATHPSLRLRPRPDADAQVELLDLDAGS